MLGWRRVEIASVKATDRENAKKSLRLNSHKSPNRCEIFGEEIGFSGQFRAFQRSKTQQVVEHSRDI